MNATQVSIVPMVCSAQALLDFGLSCTTQPAPHPDETIDHLLVSCVFTRQFCTFCRDKLTYIPLHLRQWP
jgi:hypothetical protein